MGLSNGAKRYRVYAFRWVSREREGLYQVVKCKAGGMGGGSLRELKETGVSVWREGGERNKKKESLSLPIGRSFLICFCSIGISQVNSLSYAFTNLYWK